MDNNKRPNQCKRIMDYLQKNNSITQLEAIEKLGILRLASRMSEIRKNGVEIKTEQVTVYNRHQEKARVAKYSLVKGE